MTPTLAIAHHLPNTAIDAMLAAKYDHWTPGAGLTARRTADQRCPLSVGLVALGFPRMLTAPGSFTVAQTLTAHHGGYGVIYRAFTPLAGEMVPTPEELRVLFVRDSSLVARIQVAAYDFINLFDDGQLLPENLGAALGRVSEGQAAVLAAEAYLARVAVHA